MTKVSNWNLVPGMLLVLPTLEGTPYVVKYGEQPKEGGEGVIVRCQPRYEMPPTYDDGHGHIAQAVGKSFIPRVGMTIIYKRVSSQHVPLLDELGEEQHYRMVHQDDVGMWMDLPPLELL